MGIDRSRTRTSAAPAPGGGNMQTGGAVAATMRGGTQSKDWNPTITNLLILIILEIAAFAAMRYAFGVVQRSV